MRLCLEGNCKIKDIFSDYGATQMIVCKWIKNYLSKGFKALDTKQLDDKTLVGAFL